jgi:hypothetical protein
LNPTTKGWPPCLQAVATSCDVLKEAEKFYYCACATSGLISAGAEEQMLANCWEAGEISGYIAR